MELLAARNSKKQKLALGAQPMLWLKVIGAAAVAACAFLDSFVQAGPVLLVLGMAIFWRMVVDAPQPFKAGWLWGSIVSFAGIGWMTKFIELSWWNIPAALVLSILMGAQWGLVTLLARHINASWLAAPTVGLTWALMEWSREYWPLGGLTLGSFSMCAYDFPQICDLAGIVGHWGIGAWLVTLALLLAYPKRKTLLVLWLLILPAYGLILRSWSTESTDTQYQSLKVAMLQTGVYPLQNGSTSHIHAASFAAIEELMAAAKVFEANSFMELDALIMPESTSSILLDSKIIDEGGNTVLMRQVWQNWAKFMHAPLILGTIWRDHAQSFSGAALMRPDGTEQRSAKTKLVPIAESNPKFFQRLFRAWGHEPGFTAGNSLSLWKLGDNITVAPGVCYEETFPTFARDRRRAGAQMLIFCNNNGWYPNSTLYRQHYMHGMLRAIECGCPVAQCSSTGRTGAWSPRGVEIIPAPLSDSINLVTGIIPVTLHWTPFLEWGLGGLWGAWLLCSLACMLQLLLLQSHRQGRRATANH